MSDTHTSNTSPSNPPLKGVRVIEICHMVMGPTCGMILADLGAEVIKIEPLQGDTTRHLMDQGAGFFAAYNRNKKSICLNLKSKNGLKIAHMLIASSDVIIENLRPGAMTRLGLGYTDLKELYPTLIYCSLKGFLSGPYENRVALDEIVQMMGGLAFMTGPAGKPLRAGASIIDIMGGMFGVIGIQAAIIARKKTNLGQEVKAALFETAVHAVAQHMLQFAITNKTNKPMPTLTRAWAVYDTFDTRDGEKLFVGIVSDKQWSLFCEHFNFPELLDDPSLKSNADRSMQRARILPLIQNIFATMPINELMKKCEYAGLPFSPITRPDELYQDPHLNYPSALLDLTLPTGKSVKVPNLPIELQGKRPSIKHDLPKVGEHTEEILVELGLSKNEIHSLTSQKYDPDERK